MIEKNATIEDRVVKDPITALEFFNMLPDELLLDMIKYDPEGVKAMCFALGLELNGININEMTI
jgi:hypothetical protein